VTISRFVRFRGGPHQIRCAVDGKSYEIIVGYDWVAGD
jgi:hypothetical protein